MDFRNLSFDLSSHIEGGRGSHKFNFKAPTKGKSFASCACASIEVMFLFYFITIFAEVMINALFTQGNFLYL